MKPGSHKGFGENFLLLKIIVVIEMLKKYTWKCYSKIWLYPLICIFLSLLLEVLLPNEPSWTFCWFVCSSVGRFVEISRKDRKLHVNTPVEALASLYMRACWKSHSCSWSNSYIIRKDLQGMIPLKKKQRINERIGELFVRLEW